MRSFHLATWRSVGSLPGADRRPRREMSNEGLSCFSSCPTALSFPVAGTGAPYKILFEKRILVLKSKKSCLVSSYFKYSMIFKDGDRWAGSQFLNKNKLFKGTMVLVVPTNKMPVLVPSGCYNKISV